MSALSPTQIEKVNLQNFYLSARSLLSSGIVTTWGMQRSFEEMMCGYLGGLTWQPTHTSREAVKAIAENRKRDLQRAHGIIEGKFDRYTRTMQLLQGEELSFDGWYRFYLEHDASVLLTREEHNTKKKFTIEELVELPPKSEGYFSMSGFTFSMRKKVEIAWAHEKLKELGIM